MVTFRNLLAVSECDPQFFAPVALGPIFPELAERCFLAQIKNHDQCAHRKSMSNNSKTGAICECVSGLLQRAALVK